MSTFQYFTARIKRAIEEYKDQNEGTASIEFVLIAPLMIFLYIGLYELSIAYTVNGSVNRASEVAASFPTFEEDLDETILSNIMTASTAVLDYPGFNIENLAIDVYSVEQEGDTPDTRRLVGKAAYEGSNATSLLPDLTATDFTATLSSLTAGNGFIVAQIAYNYEPTITSRYVQTVALLDRKILNPRENQGQALNIIAADGTERANLNCTPDTDRVFTCTLNGQVT